MSVPGAPSSPAGARFTAAAKSAKVCDAAGSALGGLLVAGGALRWNGLAGAVLSLTGLALTYLILPRTRTASPADKAAVSTAA